MEKISTHAGERKIQEYISRINNGESKEKILEGLSPTFIKGIENGLRNQNEDLEIQNNTETTPKNIENLIKEVSEGRRQSVKDLYRNLYTSITYPDSRKTLASALFQDVYNRYRIAEYDIDPNEEAVWERYLKSTNVTVNNKKSEWMYRGNMPTHGSETSTRGSLNVHVTPELIDQLDALITSGNINANYKFGQPGTTASPTERHDSISIYFLEDPSTDSLKKLGEIIKPFVRGDNLLGTKIADGFFMSEVGSIEDTHITQFLKDLEKQDSALVEAVRMYTSPRPGHGTSLKMSEAQYYAIKDVLGAFGHNISYSKENGFKI